MPPPRIRNPCSYLPRRLQIVASLTAFVLFCILFLGSSKTVEPYLDNVPYGPQLEHGAHQVVDHLPKLPENLNPFGTPAHKPPPDQENSRAGDTRWFSDFKWRNPFSSSVVYDEERAVLPPLKERPSVYTYFDSKAQGKDEKSRKAEQELLQIWRRAWWAQGFKPVVLGKPDAVKNPLYKRAQGLNTKSELAFEMMRWLAWDSMGTGILCNWLALPMAHYDDPLLSFLRGKDFPSLIRYKDLENGVFAGGKEAIRKALTVAVDSSNLEQATSLIDALPPDSFKIEEESESIAYYNTNAIKANYPLIHSKLEAELTRADGFAMLPSLINSHLHQTWLNYFTSGIAVLKPRAQNTTGMIEPAIDIATNLTQCTYSPITDSCPPNRPNCKPCVSSQPLPVITPPVFRNKSSLFVIGTVPHPYTLQSLIHTKDDLTTRYIRRNTSRDIWITETTKELMGTGISSFARLADLKDAVASDYGSARSLWLTAENPLLISSQPDLESLDWVLGFQIARQSLKSGKSETPVPGPERRPAPPKQEFDGPKPSEAQLKKQKDLVEKSRLVVIKGEKGGKKELDKVKEVVEAWNLADAEVWKFVRAWNARRTMVRKTWETEERKFLGY